MFPINPFTINMKKIKLILFFDNRKLNLQVLCKKDNKLYNVTLYQLHEKNNMTTSGNNCFFT